MNAARILIVVTLINLLIVAGGVGAAWWLLKPAAPVDPAQALAAAEEEEAEPVAYEFFPVDKVIVSLRGEGRERYFVLDLMLQAEKGEEPIDFAPVEPLVRNSVVAYLSGLPFEELRGLQIAELQTRLEDVLVADFARQKAVAPFQSVLVNKLIVQ
ncbi:flagellar basal body-associated FliL family protein [Stutzerimonas urumqiensis]|uniref:flagellar basal body-associated FliL family protein n=1 Tax=Stutzerimonas urumqiensis TaxID=638269 RepID=UPI000EABDE28|nr:flagellar basal body-associated FliL family protein [Stutzerimonas urumqiensis]